MDRLSTPVRATLKWIETDLLQTKGWDPITRQRPRVAAHGMIVAGFRHLASRTGDPQLHTHCVPADMTRNASPCRSRSRVAAPGSRLGTAPPLPEKRGLKATAALGHEVGEVVRHGRFADTGPQASDGGGRIVMDKR